MREVLIVGAGPTGLVLGFELLRRGIPVRLIDAREDPGEYSRAVGIQSRTLEVFEKMDLLPAFLKKGKKAQKISFHWGERKLFFSLKDLDAPYPFTLLLPQSETEAILRKHVEEAGGTVEWNTRLVNLNERTATLELPSKERVESAFSWIAGCDGAHSRVRHALQIPFRGSKIHETFLLADIEAHTPYPLEGPHIFLSKKGFGLLIPFTKRNSYRVVLPGLHHVRNPKDLTANIKKRGFSDPFEVTGIEMLSTFEIQRRHALKFRHAHVFLAGDAAHVHSPFGGQGMNTSIQDAFNLGWKLALVMKGAASEALLDTFEQERMPIAKKVLNETTRMTRLLTFSQKWFPPLFYWSLRLLLGNKKRREKAAELMSELGLSYSMNQINFEHARDRKWKGPKGGQRAPDSRLSNGKRVFELLKSQKFILLLFSENLPFAERIEKEYGEWIEVKVVIGEAVRQKYAAEANSLYLIRPDGYIGYRSRQFKTEEVIAYLLKVFHPVSLRSKL
ncbi:MAG: FAD-dependent monooxygenase [Chlamydiales bacterium]|nr:FAD-dependent monooxygenase [Chlamydiales bacterium]